MNSSTSQWMERLGNALDQVTGAIANRCAPDGKLDASLLDAAQLPCFELAWARAEWLAATTALRNARGELDQAMVQVFAVEAITRIRDRLEWVSAELDLTLVALQELASSDDLCCLQREALGGAHLHALAQELARDPDALGQVEISEELQLVRDQFQRFGLEQVAPLAEHIHREDRIIPEDILAPLRELGVFGLSIPEQFGGIAPNDGEDSLNMIVVTEALSQASLGAAGSLITRPEILSRALLTGGTQAQKEHWLPKLAQGNPLCAIAITEPDHGSDVASLTLRGTRCDGGWKLNGAKTWCTFAGKAGVLMVVTRTDPDRSLGHRGLSLLLAEKPVFEGHDFDYRQDGGGRLAGRAIPTIGYRGMHSFDLSFEDFFVPDGNVIGEENGLGKGFYFTMSGMQGGRMQTAARASGVMRAALGAALNYAQERKVFGAPLIDYQLSGVKLVQMASRYVASRYLTYAVGHMLNAGGGRMEASLIKLFACRSAEFVTREAVQLHGGMGYAEETSVSRYFVDARVLSIFEGAEETLALKVIARSLLEETLRSAA